VGYDESPLFYERLVQVLPNVAGICDSTLRIPQIGGVTLLDLESCCKKSDVKILVAGKHWFSLAEGLHEIGLDSFKDFEFLWLIQLMDNCERTGYSVLHYNTLKRMAINDELEIEDYLSVIRCQKKVAAVFGNCQAEFIAKAMSASSEFINDNMLFLFPAVQSFGKEEISQGIRREIMQQFDVFVYQHVAQGSRYGQLATEILVDKLREDCVKLSYPNMYFKAYFPQHRAPNLKSALIGSKYNPQGVVPYGDFAMDERIENGLSVEQIIKELTADNLYDEQVLAEELEATCQELSKREAQCDILILDYILSRYQHEYCFFSPNHPTSVISNELTSRILEVLGYPRLTKVPLVPENDRFEIPIYPSVRKHLGLRFDKDTYYFCKTLIEWRVDLETYVYNYKKFCYPQLCKRISVLVDVSFTGLSQPLYGNHTEASDKKLFIQHSLELLKATESFVDILVVTPEVTIEELCREQGADRVENLESAYALLDDRNCECLVEIGAMHSCKKQTILDFLKFVEETDFDIVFAAFAIRRKEGCMHDVASSTYLVDSGLKAWKKGCWTVSCDILDLVQRDNAGFFIIPENEQ
jgi:hypothetical protein